ncbi:MAG: M13 family metallopeptidase [Parcubacteria group bacterium]|nr:M13 family metallopeptidase [Parcubacteria group bacterium]
MKTTKRTSMKSKSAFRRSELDGNVKPTDDFFQFANGKWAERHAIPATESIWGPFHILWKKNLERLRILLEDISEGRVEEGGRELVLLRDYYRTAMDRAMANALGSSPLTPFFDDVNAVATIQDIVALMARFRKAGIGGPWTVTAYRDLKEGDLVKLSFGQGGLGLPEKTYYLSDDPATRKVRDAYRKHVEKMFRLANIEGDARESADTIMEIETALARVSRTNAELRQIENIYNERTIPALEREVPGVNWRMYLSELGAPPLDTVNIEVPEFMSTVSSLFQSIPLQKWKVYFSWRIITSGASFLSDAFAREQFNFWGKVVSGTKRMQPRWRRVAHDIDGTVLGEVLGKFYIQRHFSESAKDYVRTMVAYVKEAFKERVSSRPWMGEATRAMAIRKLDAVKEKVGYPDTWRDSSRLQLTNASYYENSVQVSRFEFEDMLSKVGKPADRQKWFCSPQTVNAFFEEELVSMTFPAGILQPPFFDPERDEAVNFGAIASIVGHELTHGFDDQGRKFDENGHLEDWWTPEDKEAFLERTRAFEAQIGTYRIIDDVYANGALTIGETVADLGGLVLAFYAMQKFFAEKGRPRLVNGLTPEQRFFLGYALIERSKFREERLREIAITDPHLPSYWRVNGVLSNMSEFFDAFNGGPGDKMWRPENERIEIW